MGREKQHNRDIFQKSGAFTEKSLQKCLFEILCANDLGGVAITWQLANQRQGHYLEVIIVIFSAGLFSEVSLKGRCS